MKISEAMAFDPSVGHHPAVQLKRLASNDDGR
jgi:hypothetical protein